MILYLLLNLIDIVSTMICLKLGMSEGGAILRFASINQIVIMKGLLTLAGGFLLFTDNRWLKLSSRINITKGVNLGLAFIVSSNLYWMVFA
jgi:hypothetical protein